MSGTNPFDQMRIRDDVVRYEHTETLFDLLRGVLLQLQAGWGDGDGATKSETDYMSGKQAGMRLAMDLLDEEMGTLNARWK